MIIIDWEKKGNLVRLYFGDKDVDYWGDDWNDRPYEHNAGIVYGRFVKKIVDIAFPFSWCVAEPGEDWHYRGISPFSKDDFKNRYAPFLVVASEDVMESITLEACYSLLLGSNGVHRLYLGDDESSLQKLIDNGAVII